MGGAGTSEISYIVYCDIFTVTEISYIVYCDIFTVNLSPQYYQLSL